MFLQMEELSMAELESDRRSQLLSIDSRPDRLL